MDVLGTKCRFFSDFLWQIKVTYVSFQIHVKRIHHRHTHTDTRLTALFPGLPG